MSVSAPASGAAHGPGPGHAPAPGHATGPAPATDPAPSAGSAPAAAPGTAVVTGAAGAIGRAVAERLAASGHAVLAVDLDAAVERTAQAIRAQGGEAHACVADLAAPDAPDAIGAAAARTGRPLALLVNNAGVTRDARAAELSDAALRLVLRVNLLAPLRLALALAPRLRDGGAIVNVASRAALGNFGQANYVASKAGLVGATRALALTLAPRVRVNAVAPGLVETPMTAAMPPDVLGKLVARVPAGRMGSPREIAEVVAFLGSPAAAYVTGQVLLACGGRGVG